MYFFFPFSGHTFTFISKKISLNSKSHKVKVKVKSLNRVQLFATPWTVAYQASPSMGFSRQEYWSGLPFPSPGDPPDPGIKPRSPTLEADALTSEPTGKPNKIKYPIKSFLNTKTFRVGVELINNVVVVSGGELRVSAICIHVSILPQTTLPPSKFFKKRKSE